MRNWRDDRMKLRSNIWWLKLALRVAARDTDDALHAVRLIERQRGEIKRLEAANKDSTKEVADIKSALQATLRGKPLGNPTTSWCKLNRST